jgi:hypothetical protein
MRGRSRLQRLNIPGSYLDTAEFALMQEGLAGVAGAQWGPYAKVARDWMKLPGDDPRAQLSNDVLRANHPEVLIDYEGRREIADPATEWFEFTGRGAGRVKCSSASAQGKCAEQAQRYEELKRRARALLDTQG